MGVSVRLIVRAGVVGISALRIGGAGGVGGGVRGAVVTVTAGVGGRVRF